MTRLSLPTSVVRIAAVLALAPLLAACSIAPPPPFSEESKTLIGLNGEAFAESFALAPVRISYRPKPFPGDELPENPDFYEPPLTPRDKLQLSKDLHLATRRLLDDRSLVELPDFSGEVPAAELIARNCIAAENRNAQVYLDLELTSHRVTARGPDLLGSIVEFVGYCFYPFNWIVPNERFQVSRALTVRAFDVRDPVHPIWQTELSGSDERILSEFEHGLVFLSTFRWAGRAIFSENHPGARFSADEWTTVTDEITPHATRSLQRNLLTSLDQNLRRTLKDEDVQRRLIKGSPATARLYSVCIGIDGGEVRYAARDASRLDALLRSRAGVLDRHGVLLTEADPEAVIAAIGRLRTKSVDRVLFFFAGRGIRREGKQGLVLSKDQVLWVDELAAAFRETNAGTTLFVLDTSFGGVTYRGKDRGRRTALGSERAEDSERHLAPLADPDRGWTVIASARGDETTGEYQREGLFSGLLLSTLEERELLDLKTLDLLLGRRYEERSAAWLGRPARIFVRPVEPAARRSFRLRLVTRATPAPGSRPGDAPGGKVGSEAVETPDQPGPDDAASPDKTAAPDSDTPESPKPGSPKPGRPKPESPKPKLY